ncbi:MYG1 family protein [Roseomonas sp. SG15]|uniref:MYG1 family protein n=1 Tax=Roseomonas indoligenes TaxID=2820811 RepID=A0A940S6Q9_9PROT|nr:MYG1 family protein [Pararoseomonas indoligenes]
MDNGVERAAPTDLTSMVDTFNSAWDAPSQSDPIAFEEHQRQGFLRASRMVAEALERQVEKERGAAFAYQAVAQAWEDCKAGVSGIHPDLLELPLGMPWQRPAFDLAMPVLYVMSPEPDGKWKVQAMPAEKGSFASRLEMPAAWRGLQDAALEAACGIPGAVFVHRGGHLAIAATRDAALAMAKACLTNKLSPAEALRKAWGR